MIVVQIPATLMPQQVDIPDEVELEKGKTKKLKRSVKGALHFRPSSVKSLTSDEMWYIKKNHQDLHKHLFVVSSAPDTVEKKVSPPKDPPPTNPPSGDDEEGKNGKGGKRGKGGK